MSGNRILTRSEVLGAIRQACDETRLADTLTLIFHAEQFLQSLGAPRPKTPTPRRPPSG